MVVRAALAQEWWAWCCALLGSRCCLSAGGEEAQNNTCLSVRDAPQAMCMLRYAYLCYLSSTCVHLVRCASVQFKYDKLLGGKRHFVRLGLRIQKLAAAESSGSSSTGTSGNTNGSDTAPSLTGALLHNEFVNADGPVFARFVAEGVDGEVTSKPLPPALLDALTSGIHAAFGRGPLLGYPLAGLRVSIIEAECETNNDTSPAAVRACVARCMEQGLLEGGVDVLEPTMSVEIRVPEQDVGGVLNDLTSQRRGKIREVASTGPGHTGAALNSKVTVRAQVPLRQLVGYSTTIRSQTAGEGSFAMEFCEYAHVGPLLQRQMVESIATGGM